MHVISALCTRTGPLPHIRRTLAEQCSMAEATADQQASVGARSPCISNTTEGSLWTLSTWSCPTLQTHTHAQHHHAGHACCQAASCKVFGHAVCLRCQSRNNQSSTLGPGDKQPPTCGSLRDHHPSSIHLMKTTSTHGHRIVYKQQVWQPHVMTGCMTWCQLQKTSQDTDWAAPATQKSSVTTGKAITL